MSKSFPTNTEVQWNWGDGTATGKVREVFRDPVSRTIDGTEVKRDADEDNPAYLLEQADGTRVLKSHSELQRAS